MKKPKRFYNNYEDELRMYNDAQAVRRGKKQKGFAPSFFADVFSYEQPRRNMKGCGDVRVVNTETGESGKVHCDEVTSVFAHRRAPTGGKFALRVDRRDLADEK